MGKSEISSYFLPFFFIRLPGSSLFLFKKSFAPPEGCRSLSVEGSFFSLAFLPPSFFFLPSPFFFSMTAISSNLFLFSTHPPLLFDRLMGVQPPSPPPAFASFFFTGNLSPAHQRILPMFSSP